MNITKLNIIIIVFIVSIFPITTKAENSKHSNKVIVVLFDISSSITSESKKNYLNYFNNLILKKIKPGDKLFVSKVSDNSLNEPIIEMSIKPYEPFTPKETDNDFYKKTKKQKHLISYKNYVQKTKISTALKVKEMIKNNSNATDIFGSMGIADRIFKAYSNKFYDLRLVLLSDVVNAFDNYNFYKINLTSQNISNIIDKEKSDGNIPHFDKVHVFIWGAYTESSKKLNQLYNFWHKYFESCGSTLEDFGLTPLKGI